MMAKNSINVLLVEDNKDFADSFKRQSQSHNIQVKHVTNLEDMLKVLKQYHSGIATVVLDVKCLITPDQEIERPDFIGAAIHELDRQYPEVPRAIFTADSTSYESLENMMTHEKRFMKTSDGLNDLFNLIKENAKNLHHLKVKEKYRHVFEIFSKGHLNINIESQLLDLLLSMDIDNTKTILDNLSAIRRIQEASFQAINKAHKRIIPDHLLKENKDITFRGLHKHLSGNKNYQSNYKPTSEVFYDGVIESFSEMIYAVTSDNGAHNPYEAPLYFPTKHTVKGCVYALLDFLLWFKTVMDKES